MRTCSAVGCNEPDVVAPHEGTWPTCSDKMPLCKEHLWKAKALALLSVGRSEKAEAAAEAARQSEEPIYLLETSDQRGTGEEGR